MADEWARPPLTPAEDTFLRSEATAFAERLTTLLNGTVTSGAMFTVFVTSDAGTATVATGGVERRKDTQLIPLSISRAEQDRAKAKLWLRLAFTVGLDVERRNLTVLTSLMGLCIDPTTNNCPIRVEYERERRRQQAHVHLHATSTDVARAYELVEQPPLDVHKLHFPVGGRRFRPTVEDFIEFLYEEGLVKLKSDGRAVIQRSRGDWDERQTRAAARRYPHAAAAQLRDMGYQVVDPQGETR